MADNSEPPRLAALVELGRSLRAEAAVFRDESALLRSEGRRLRSELRQHALQVGAALRSLLAPASGTAARREPAGPS